MIVKLLNELLLECLSLKGGCRGSSESTHFKMSHCWYSYALAYYAKVLASTVHVYTVCQVIPQKILRISGIPQ